MKKATLGFAVTLLFTQSCMQSDNRPDAQPSEVNNHNNWIVYDGRVPLDEKRSLSIELSIKTGENPNEGSYQLREVEEGEQGEGNLPLRKGIFSAEYDREQDEWILVLHNSAHEKGVKRIYRADHNTIREVMFRKNDLMLKRQGDTLMIVLDHERQPITLDPESNPIRRTSRLFTVEGYFVYRGNTAEFFEMNTREKWQISKRGEFYEASRQYHQLAKEKFESLYLKAVAYSIAGDDQHDRLVFKRIIQASSSPVSE